MKKQLIHDEHIIGKTITNIIDNGEQYVIHLNDDEYIILESEYDSSELYVNNDYHKIDNNINQIQPYLCEELYNNGIINDEEYKILKQKRLEELKKDHESVRLHEINELKRLKLKYPEAE